MRDWNLERHQRCERRDPYRRHGPLWSAEIEVCCRLEEGREGEFSVQELEGLGPYLLPEEVEKSVPCGGGDPSEGHWSSSGRRDLPMSWNLLEVCRRGGGCLSHEVVMCRLALPESEGLLLLLLLPLPLCLYLPRPLPHYRRRLPPDDTLKERERERKS